MRTVTCLTSEPLADCAGIRFALAGGMAATFSSLIGGGIATSTDYAWVFFLVACAAIPLSLLAFVLLPAGFDTRSRSASSAHLSHIQKFYSLDLIGALSVALFLILFVFSLTEGNRVGWDSARTIVPLALGVAVVLPAFLLWEEYGRTRRGYEAALPLKLWKMGNFTVLFLASLVSFYCYGAVYITFTTLWSEPPYLCTFVFFSAGSPPSDQLETGSHALETGKVLPTDRTGDHASSWVHAHPRC